MFSREQPVFGYEADVLINDHIHVKFAKSLPDLIDLNSAADPGMGPFRPLDPGSGIGAFLTPGFGIRNRFIPDPGSRISDPGSRIPDPKLIFLRA
jgi:hypothetical protein